MQILGTGRACKYRGQDGPANIGDGAGLQILGPANIGDGTGLKCIVH